MDWYIDGIVSNHKIHYHYTEFALLDDDEYDEDFDPEDALFKVPFLPKKRGRGRPKKEDDFYHDPYFDGPRDRYGIRVSWICQTIIGSLIWTQETQTEGQECQGQEKDHSSSFNNVLSVQQGISRPCCQSNPLEGGSSGHGGKDIYSRLNAQLIVKFIL